MEYENMSTMPMYQMYPYMMQEMQQNPYMMQGMYMSPNTMGYMQQPMMMEQMGYSIGRDDDEDDFRNGSHHHGSHHHSSHHHYNYGYYNPYMYDCFGYIPKCGYCGHHHR